ncbi:MAG: Maf family protein [Promethearchaeota archaeon]
MKKIILASKSIDRSELLKQAGISFEILVTNVNEEEFKRKIPDPVSLVEELAKQKALAAKNKLISRKNEYIIIGFDTVVEHQRDIIGKAKNEKEAFNILKKLQGTTHSLITGIAISEVPSPKIIVDHDITRVKFLPLSNEDIWAYIKSGEWRGRAGAYSIRQKAGLFIDYIEGSSSNVMGLPLNKLFLILKREFNLNLLL